MILMADDFAFFCDLSFLCKYVRHTSASSVPIQELFHLHEKVSGSMLFLLSVECVVVLFSSGWLGLNPGSCVWWW